METVPEVSVIMSTHGLRDKECLIRAVQSVLEQTFTDLELILCSDGGDEERTGFLRNMADRDDRIHLIFNAESRGLAYSLNRCIGMAQGKYLARMDDDDLCETERIALQWEYLESHPEVDFVGCNAKLMDTDGIWGRRQMPEEPKKKDFLRFSPYIHPSVMFRRDIFAEQEAYRTDMRRGEDYELFMRLTALGYRGYNLQKELLCYREDRDSYDRRSLGSRLDEVRIRYHGFFSLGILMPSGWLCGLRPLAACMAPAVLVYRMKRMYYRRL